MKPFNRTMLFGLLTYCLSLQVTAAGVANTCSNQHITLSKDFDGGRFASCKVQTNNVFQLTLVPENIPINPSPWYAFEIAADKVSSITIVLNYSHGKSRYWPQLSRDFSSWKRLGSNQVVLSEDEKKLSLQLDVKAGKTWIAAQPVIDNDSYQDWLELMAQDQPAMSLHQVGKSVQGRNLLALASVAKNKKPVIVLLGRQHPPEVTGAMAMRSFVETLLQETELAKTFRGEINLLILPNVNPDGVAAGNWRHNFNGVDLNRDWGPFSQPETRQIKDFIEQYIVDKSLWMVIDFHSTWRDVFYIQRQEQKTRFPLLIASWLQKINEANSPITFEPKPGHSPHNATSKTYFYENYKIPAITYELGDDDEPKDIELSSQIAAKALMQLLLEKVGS